MIEKTKPTNVHWDHVRQPWQKHIVNMYQLIDKHSEMYTKTGDIFHRHCYDVLTKYLCDLKAKIKSEEKELTN